MICFNTKQKHEKEECAFRKKIICTKGCGLPLEKDLLGSHDCIVALKVFIATQENQINAIKAEMHKFIDMTEQKTKWLLDNIAYFKSFPICQKSENINMSVQREWSNFNFEIEAENNTYDCNIHMKETIVSSIFVLDYYMY